MKGDRDLLSTKTALGAELGQGNAADMALEVTELCPSAYLWVLCPPCCRDAAGKVGYSSPEEPLEQAVTPGKRQECVWVHFGGCSARDEGCGGQLSKRAALGAGHQTPHTGPTGRTEAAVTLQLTFI